MAVDIFGQTFGTETFLYKGLEACQISEELDRESHGMTESRKSMEIDIGLNSVSNFQ